MGAAGFDHGFLRAARVAQTLITAPAVGGRWERASVLPRMSVGALACHLGQQVVHARDLGMAPGGEGDVLPGAAEHYRRAAWVITPDLDDPVNDRSGSEEQARAGHEALGRRTHRALEDLQALVASGSLHDVVAIPWQGWRLRRDHFLLTRMVEVVVHCDDLARSVEASTPVFPDDVFEPVLSLLATLATQRHGQAALVSALSRAERTPAMISAF